MIEEWRDIKGYKSYYQVSNFGRVKSLDRVVLDRGIHRKFKGRVLKFGKSAGYLNVSLSYKGKSRSVKVHRLVLETFRPNTFNKSDCNHIDGNKQNNHIRNLEWSTRSENIQHAKNAGLRENCMGERHSFAKLNEKQVLEIVELINRGTKLTSIAKLFNISQQSISSIKLGITWSSVTGIT